MKCKHKDAMRKPMSEGEMFEKTFERPTNFFELCLSKQWQIDKELGILDWVGEDLTEEDKIRFKNHYKKEKKSLTNA